MKFQNIFFLNVLALLSIKTSLAGDMTVVSSLCLPAEEGKRTSIAFAMTLNSQQQIMVSVERDKYTISRCFIPDNCEDFRPKYYKTTLTIGQNFNVTITVDVFKTTRKTENYWYLIHREVISECRLQVFFRPRLITCFYEVFDNNLHIRCLSSEVYPEVKGRISNRFREIDKGKLDAMMEWSNSKHPVNATYYFSDCSLTIPMAKLQPGLYEMNVTMYPNVTGDERDVEFSTRYLFPIKLEYATLVLEECRWSTDELVQFVCACKFSDLEPVNVSTGLEDNNSDGLTSFNEAHSTTHRYNEATDKSHSLNCSKYAKKDNCTITCGTNQRIPSGLCQVSLKNIRRIRLRGNEPNKEEDIEDYKSLNFSGCHLNITISHYSQRQHDLQVIRGGYIKSNDDRPNHSSVNSSISGSVDEAVNKSRELSYIILLVSVVCGIVLIAAMFLVVSCHKLKGNKRTDNMYDLPNYGSTEGDLAHYQRWIPQGTAPTGCQQLFSMCKGNTRTDNIYDIPNYGFMEPELANYQRCIPNSEVGNKTHSNHG